MKNSVSPTPSRSSSIYSGSFRNSTSPLPPPSNYSTNCMTAAAKRYKYLRRLVKFRQMDFEFALWQMLYLFIHPDKVYMDFYYRKQMKSQFARDDPAFLVLLILWMLGSSIVFSIILDFGFVGFLKFTLYVVFVDCLFVGIVMASILWYISNKYLKKENYLDQDVEWGYAFDVHLNAFFPPLIILHLFMIIFYHVLISRDLFFARLFGNMLWLVALTYYVYITFLGYCSHPILHKTKAFLYPLLVLFLLFIVSVSIGWNVSRAVVYFYTYRILE